MTRKLFGTDGIRGRANQEPMTAETALRGASLDDGNTLRSAIAASFDDARPLAHNAFKVELAQRVALRALQTAGARA